MRLPDPEGDIVFDDRNRFQGIRHVHGIGGHGVLFKAPLDLHDLGALGKKLTVGGKALPIRLHHHVIRYNHFQLSFGLTDRDIPPVFVSFEVRKRQLAQFQRVPVLRRKSLAAQDR